MKSKKPRHLKSVDSWDPSSDPHVIAALQQIVRAIMEHPEEEWISRLRKAARDISTDLEALDAKVAARNASPIYRRARKNRIRVERAGKVRGKKK